LGASGALEALDQLRRVVAAHGAFLHLPRVTHVRLQVLRRYVPERCKHRFRKSMNNFPNITGVAVSQASLHDEPTRHDVDPLPGNMSERLARGLEQTPNMDTSVRHCRCELQHDPGGGDFTPLSI